MNVTRPLVVIISGPSGAGKDTVLNRMKERGVEADFIVTTTTRPRRDYEVDGVSYNFVSREAFDEMIKNNDLLEYARVYGNWYGVPRQAVLQALEKGSDAVIKVDIQGAATIKKNLPGACFIFITPPEIAELPGRLKRRNTESEAERELRLKTAGREFEQLSVFDYVVLNPEGEIDTAVEDVLTIIRAEKLKVKPVTKGPA